LGLEQLDHLAEQCCPGVIAPPGHLQGDVLLRVIALATGTAATTASSQDQTGRSERSAGRHGSSSGECSTHRCASIHQLLKSLSRDRSTGDGPCQYVVGDVNIE